MATLHVFTLEAANAMIPKLSILVSRQFVRRSDIEDRLKVLGAMTGELPTEIVQNPNDSPEVLEIKRELILRIQEYQSGWHEVEELGCVLKDPRSGLIDFYGRVDGNLVWLCWKFGESEVTHYHALDEGYTGRKEIRRSTKVRLLN